MNSGSIYSKETLASLDFNLAVAAGMVKNTSHINKFGFNKAIDPGSTPETIWSRGGLYVPPTAARTHDLVSTSVNDTSAGTGARTVEVFGLDSSFDEISEVIILNGTTNVPTVNAYRRMFRAKVKTAGSVASNAGTITATAQTDVTVSAQIDALIGQTAMAHFTVPAGQRAYLTNLQITIVRFVIISQAQAQLTLNARENLGSGEEVELVVDNFSNAVEGSGTPVVTYLPYKVFNEKTDISIICTRASDDLIEITANFNLILRDI